MKKEEKSYKDKFRDIENDPKRKESREFKKNMQESAGIDTKNISPKVIESLNIFKKMLNQLGDEIKRRRR